LATLPFGRLAITSRILDIREALMLWGGGGSLYLPLTNAPRIVVQRVTFCAAGRPNLFWPELREVDLMGNLSIVVKGIFLLNIVMASNGKGIRTGFTMPRRIFTYPLALIFSPLAKKWGNMTFPSTTSCRVAVMPSSRVSLLLLCTFLSELKSSRRF
jgi:hypothetical protein